MAAGWWHPIDGGISIAVRVTPGARRSEVIAVDPDRVRVRLAAPPVEGKANEALRRFLADACDVRASAVTLLRGERSRDKVVAIAGIDAPPTSLTA